MAKLILYQAKSPYPGDITKNCALTGKEVDNNFLNLKGEDIETIYLDEETKKLTFVRFKDGLKNCNGETIESRIEVDLTALEYVTGYKYEDGVIKITYSNGKTSEMSVEAFGMAVATDSTISGNGSKSKPLSISQAMRTGQYKPVNGIIDIAGGERLPETAIDGEGYITHEVKSDFGMFYTSDQALLLDGILRMENSEWRVPSKKDWDKLLNYLEECDRYKNHSLRSENEIDARGMVLGNLAGWKAKSLDTDEADYWICGGTNNADFLRIYPTGSFSALTGAYSGFGDHAHFWTITEGDMSCRNFYSKKFVDLRGTVTQIEAMPASKLTIRLVKDFIGDNYHKFEEIHGRIYETKLVASESEECNQVWTMVNVDIADYEHDLVPTPMPEDATSAITTEYAYYINRWDGYKWDKVEMTEGDCVVILGDACGEMAEYRLECGVLVNRDKFWQDQIDELASAATATTEVIEELKERVDVLEEQVSAITDTVEELEDQMSAVTEAVEELEDQMSAVTEAVEELEERTDALEEQVSAITDAIEELEETVDDLTARTEALEDQMSAVTEAVEELEERTDALEDVVDDLTVRTEALEEQMSAVTEAVEELEDIVGTGFTGASITEVVENHEERIEALEDAKDNYVTRPELGELDGNEPQDVPLSAATCYTQEMFENGDITIFGYINASNDYGYWKTPDESE